MTIAFTKQSGFLLRLTMSKRIRMSTDGSCSTPECTKPIRCKGLCATCYYRPANPRVRMSTDGPCSTPECKKPVRCKGMCASCYYRPVTSEQKALASERSARWRARNPEKHAEINKRGRQANPDYWRTWTRNNLDRVSDYTRRHRLHRKGFGIELFNRCWDFQKGRCAICSRALVQESHRIDSAQADHCHTLVKGRGILCVPCNTSLGFYEKHQRGLITIEPYELYLSKPPATLLEACACP